MKTIKKLLKIAMPLAVVAFIFTSCDDEATQFIVKKTFTSDFEVSEIEGKQSYTGDQTVNINELLDSDYNLSDIEFIAFSLTVKDNFDGEADELTPIAVTITLSKDGATDFTKTVSESFIVGTPVEIELENSVSISEYLSNGDITVGLTIESNKTLTDDEFTLSLDVEAQATASN